MGAEGMMLVGAFMAAWAGAGAAPFVGFWAAVAVGGLAGLGLGWVMVSMRADQVVVGVAFNILMLGLTTYAFEVVTKSSPKALDVGQPSTITLSVLADIPWIGPVFDMNWIAYLAFALVPIIAYVLFHTGLGTRLRACGEYAEGARAMGIGVVRTRLLAMMVSGMLAGAAGSFLVLGDVGVFRRNITGGRGYIAFVIVILARYRPVGALVAALSFGLCQALTFYLQLKGIDIPSQFVLATPYVVTLLAIVVLGKRIGRPPAEEGRPLQLSR
jgi:simple sugar transport system permease protein